MATTFSDRFMERQESNPELSLTYIVGQLRQEDEEERRREDELHLDFLRQALGALAKWEEEYAAFVELESVFEAAEKVRDRVR